MGLFQPPVEVMVQRPGNGNDLLQGLSYMPIVPQMPLGWSHMKMTLEHLFFCSCQETSDGYELVYRTLGLCQNVPYFGLQGLPLFWCESGYSLREIVLVTYEVENLLEGFQSQLLMIY